MWRLLVGSVISLPGVIRFELLVFSIARVSSNASWNPLLLWGSLPVEDTEIVIGGGVKCVAAIDTVIPSFRWCFLLEDRFHGVPSSILGVPSFFRMKLGSLLEAWRDTSAFPKKW